MNHNSNEPLWLKSFYAWYNQTLVDYTLTGANADETAARQLADSMDWDMCHYCTDPCCCGHPQQDQSEVSQRTRCPYALFRYLYHLRSA